MFLLKLRKTKLLKTRDFFPRALRQIIYIGTINQFNDVFSNLSNRKSEPKGKINENKSMII